MGIDMKVVIGDATLYHGDCMDILPTLGKVDAVITDPPYGTTACKWDSVIPLEPMWKNIKLVLKSSGVVAMTASQPFSSVLLISNIEMFKHEWIWIKNRGSNFANTVREPMKEHESILIFSTKKWTYNRQMQPRSGGGVALAGAVQKDKGGKTENYGKFAGKDIKLSKMRVPSTWQKFNCEVGSHPTQKPVSLMEYLIKTYTNKEEIVLDFATGSGTTGVACANLGRKFIGIEKERKYFDIACERIEAAYAQGRLEL